jgi:VWFA-related protein
MRSRPFIGVLLMVLFGCIFAGAQDSRPPDPRLVHRPPAKAPSARKPEGRIHLDVAVSDAQGKPVQGLEPWDFQVTDEAKPTKVLSFQGFDGVVAKPQPPVEVILLIDEVNLPFQQVAFVKSELSRFLRQDNGKLAQPVSIMRLTDAGLRVQPRPTLDGNAQESVVNQIKGQIGFINAAMGVDGALQRLQISEHALASIAENEAKKPGRKLLVWVGPGWPMLESAQFVTPNDTNRRRYFDAIVELTNKLREARITVNSVSGYDPNTAAVNPFHYQSFLNGVRSPHQAAAGYLALKVLAVQTGGRILGPDNDLAGQINTCIADANSFYRISFNPPPAGGADEYHELKLQIDKPGLAVRTNAGYYNEPSGN